MMYRKGRGEDKQDLLDFLNYVFSLEYEPTNFRELIPKVYGRERDMEKIHHMLIEENRIKAVIGMYPLKLCLGGQNLKIGYVGSVSVHPYERRRGYMKELMKKVSKEACAENYDMVALSGQRQRYEYFGFYRGGSVLQFQISDTNLRHYFQKKFADSSIDKEQILLDLELEVCKQESNTDTYMDAIYQIYQNRIMTGRDRELFYDTMRSFHTELYAVTMHGVCIGYMAYDYVEDYINEFELLDMDLLPYVLENFMEYAGCSVLGIKTTLLDERKNAFLTGICERYTLGQAQMYHILNYEKVFRAALEAKKQLHRLADGKIIIEIKENGAYAITIEKGEIKVAKTKRKADLVMTEEQCIRILLSIDYNPSCISEEVEGLGNAPQGWFPLPFAIETADTF